MYKKIALLILSAAAIILLLVALRPSPKVTRAFYYWKTTFATDTNAEKTVQKLGVTLLYVRCFDVDWSEAAQHPVPRAAIQSWDFKDMGIGRICPVVFITPRTFERTSEDKLEALSEKIVEKIKETSKNIGEQIGYRRFNPYCDECGEYYEMEKKKEKFTANFYSQIQEIQIDCDWGEKTKDKYFTFLQLLKKKIPGKTLSVTLRLYPYKYSEKMGIPPADKAMLMCYNTGVVQHAETRNAILDISEVKVYLTDVKPYPLPLDVALPLFHWGVWFRYGQCKGIIHELSASAWQKDSAFASFDANHFTIKKDTVIGDNYFREGDDVRFESPTPESLTTAATIIRETLGLQERNISFFHWDSDLIKEHENSIDATYQTFE